MLQIQPFISIKLKKKSSRKNYYRPTIKSTLCLSKITKSFICIKRKLPRGKPAFIGRQACQALKEPLL